MNPLSKVTGALSHPMRTAGTVAGHVLGAATTGVRTTTRVVAWAAKQGRGETRVSEHPATAGPGTSGTAPRTGTSPADAPLARNEVTPDPRAPQPPAASESFESTAEQTGTSARTATAEQRPSPRKGRSTQKTASRATPSAKVPPRSRKAPAKKAPSAKAATAGPALAKLAKEGGSSIPTPAPPTPPVDPERPEQPEQPEPAPLLDPATVKAVKSETDVLRAAADPHKD